ncbi:MAG: nuclear transport factor 2 family protein, partial [Candidatus Nanopelagicaceae bacterium]
MELNPDDRYEIESLMKRYCLYFDTKRAADLASLFTSSARIDYGPEVEPVIGSKR